MDWISFVCTCQRTDTIKKTYESSANINHHLNSLRFPGNLRCRCQWFGLYAWSRLPSWRFEARQCFVWKPRFLRMSRGDPTRRFWSFSSAWEASNEIHVCWLYDFMAWSWYMLQWSRGKGSLWHYQEDQGTWQIQMALCCWQTFGYVFPCYADVWVVWTQDPSTPGDFRERRLRSNGTRTKAHDAMRDPQDLPRWFGTVRCMNKKIG